MEFALCKDEIAKFYDYQFQDWHVHVIMENCFFIKCANTSVDRYVEKLRLYYFSTETIPSIVS